MRKLNILTKLLFFLSKYSFINCPRNCSKASSRNIKLRHVNACVKTSNALVEKLLHTRVHSFGLHISLTSDILTIHFSFGIILSTMVTASESISSEEMEQKIISQIEVSICCELDTIFYPTLYFSIILATSI